MDDDVDDGKWILFFWRIFGYLECGSWFCNSLVSFNERCVGVEGISLMVLS